MMTVEMTVADADGKQLTLPFDILPIYDWESQFSSIGEMEEFFSKLKLSGVVSSNFAPIHTEYFRVSSARGGGRERPTCINVYTDNQKHSSIHAISV